VAAVSRHLQEAADRYLQQIGNAGAVSA
jgi:hypothetical protein